MLEESSILLAPTDLWGITLKEEIMAVKVGSNGRTFLLSMDELLRLLHGMTPANPVEVLDCVGGKRKGRAAMNYSPLFYLLKNPLIPLFLN